MTIVKAEPRGGPRIEGLNGVKLLRARTNTRCEARQCMMGSRTIPAGMLYVRLYGADEEAEATHGRRAHAGCLHIGIDERIDAAIRAAGPDALQWLNEAG